MLGRGLGQRWGAQLVAALLLLTPIGQGLACDDEGDADAAAALTSEPAFSAEASTATGVGVTATANAAPQPTPMEAASVAAVGVAAQARAVGALPIDLPILVYHHVVPASWSDSEAGRALYVTPAEFERQLKYLQDNGYQAISFGRLADYFTRGTPLPARPVIISFDDGWENQFTYALPLLQKYAFTATFFVVTDYLDHQNFMSFAQLGTLLGGGMEIGSHSRTHPTLSNLNPQRLRNEIAGSKEIIEKRLGVAIGTFAYPYGAYSAAVAANVKAAGYRTARTVDRGMHAGTDNLTTLPAMTFSAFLHSTRRSGALAGGEAPRPGF